MTVALKPALNDDLLIHYGVKGMEWGKRKEYVEHPLKSAKQVQGTIREHRESRLQKKADVLNTRISELNTEIESLEGSKKLTDKYRRASNKAILSDVTKERDKVLKDVEAVQNGKLTSTQKKVIAGAVVAGAVLAAVAVGQGKQSGALNSWQLRGEAFLRGQKVPFKTDQSLTGKMSPQDLLKKVAAPVNPNYRAPGGQMNCRRSTFTYELRRRGYDVVATTAAHGTGQSESGFINAVTPGSRNFISSLSVTESVQKAEKEFLKKASQVSSEAFDVTRTSMAAPRDRRTNPVTKVVLTGLKVAQKAQSIEDFDKGLSLADSSSKKVLQAIQQQPEGARGEVLFNFGTFAHSMAYEVINGTAHIFDSQKANLFDAVNLVENKWDGFHSAEITRLDNVDLDLKFLSRWATNRS